MENRRHSAGACPKGTRRRQTTPKSKISDLLATDGDRYPAVLENEHVRVLRYDDKPGDRNLQPAHPDYVVYPESSLRGRLAFPDGRTQEADIKKGSVGWMQCMR